MADHKTRESNARAVLSIVLVAGLWLLVSAQVLGYGAGGDRAVAVEIGAGIALVILSALQLATGASHRLSVLVVWVGVLLFVAPVVLRYGYLDRIEAAYVNDMLTAVVVIAAGVLAARWTSRAKEPAPRP